MAEAPDSPAVLTAKTAKHGEAIEHQSAARKASFVAAIDWVHGSKTDELISFQATGSDEAISDQLNSQASGQAKVTVKQPAPAIVTVGPDYWPAEFPAERSRPGRLIKNLNRQLVRMSCVQ